jgi:hypothetical protein
VYFALSEELSPTARIEGNSAVGFLIAKRIMSDSLTKSGISKTRQAQMRIARFLHTSEQKTSSVSDPQDVQDLHANKVRSGSMRSVGEVSSHLGFSLPGDSDSGTKAHNGALVLLTFLNFRLSN